MATSSITNNFVISGKEQVEILVNLLSGFSCPKNPDVAVTYLVYFQGTERRIYSFVSTK